MDDKIKRSLHNSLLDGIFANIMSGFTDTFMAPYALAIGASASIIGFLTSLPNLVGAFFQSISASMAERLGSRQALINPAVLMHTLMLIPIIVIPYVMRADAVWYLVVFYAAFVSLNLLAFPAWSSMMADHVPEAERGKVFGMRNRIFGITNVSAMFLAGSILYLAKRFFSAHDTFLPAYAGIIGFTIIFTIAFLARLVSWHFLTKMYEPKLEIRDEHRFTIWDFVKRVRKTNFGRFVIFSATMNFMVNISGPFLPVYMIKELKFDYFTYTLITLTATLTIFFMMNWWGLHADHIGNRRVIRLTSFFLPLVPALWIVSHNPVYLIAAQVVAGFFWAGFNLSSSNFIYDAVTPEKRTRCIAYFNVVNGIAITLAAITGGLLLRVLPPVFGYKVMPLFFISAVGRILVAVFLANFKEVRQVKHISNRDLFYSIIGLRPILATLSKSE
jgi:MFS family permease